MVNALWRFLLTLIFITSLLLVLAIIWDVPQKFGVMNIDTELSKLPSTLLIILAMITGIWGTWSRPTSKVVVSWTAEKVTHTTQGDVFAVPNSDLRSKDLSPVEAANQTAPAK